MHFGTVYSYGALVGPGTYESLSANIGLDSGAFLLTTMIVISTCPCPFTRTAHWRPSACVDANWSCKAIFHIWSAPAAFKPC